MVALLRRSLEPWRKLRDSEHHLEEIMHTTHVETLISAKSPIADETRLNQNENRNTNKLPTGGRLYPETIPSFFLIGAPHERN